MTRGRHMSVAPTQEHFAYFVQNKSGALTQHLHFSSCRTTIRAHMSAGACTHTHTHTLLNTQGLRALFRDISHVTARRPCVGSWASGASYSHQRAVPAKPRVQQSVSVFRTIA
ncbi:unnamed protein product [Ixodes pacificus]